MCATHWLLNYKFFSYGLEVFSYMESLKSITPLEGSRKHDPMCELFPTEVTMTMILVEINWCYRCLAAFKSAPPLEAWIRVTSSASSATTCSTRSTSSFSGFGGFSSFLLQFWDSSTEWQGSSCQTFRGWFPIVYPLFDVFPPIRWLLLRKIHGNQLSNVKLRSADYFVLQQVFWFLVIFLM